VFSFTFDKFSASWLNKRIYLFKKNLTDCKLWNGIVYLGNLCLFQIPLYSGFTDHLANEFPRFSRYSWFRM